METVSQLFANEPVLGFDIEWMAQASAKDGIRRNVSLIQIASETRIALFHIAVFAGTNVPADFVAPTFKKLMESKSITKAGVAIKGDSTLTPESPWHQLSGLVRAQSSLQAPQVLHRTGSQDEQSRRQSGAAG